MYIYVSIVFSMYNIAFTGIVIIMIINIMKLDQVTQIVLQSVGVLWGSFFCSFAFVLPRLLEVNKEHRTTDIRRLSQTTVMMNNPTIPDVASSCEQSYVSSVEIKPESSISNPIDTKKSSNNHMEQSLPKNVSPLASWENIVNFSMDSELESDTERIG
jgi:hypothetical protein